MSDDIRRQDQAESLSVFTAYTREDEAYLDRLRTALTMLRRQGMVDVWHDRRIAPGEDWESEINREIENAVIIILLVSPDFLESDYCYGTELQIALHRHNTGQARVIPIVVRPCEWHETDLAKIQALPRDGLPVSRWSDQDEAWLDVTAGIRRAVESMLRERSGGAAASSAVSPRPSTMQRLGPRPERLSRSEDQAILRILPGDGHAGPWIYRVPNDRRAEVKYRIQNIGKAPARDIRARVTIGDNEPVEINGPPVLHSLAIADREGFVLPLARPLLGGAGARVPADYPDSDLISITLQYSDFQHELGVQETEPICFHFTRVEDGHWFSRQVPCPAS